MVYIAHEDWNNRPDKTESLPVKIPKKEFILSNTEIVNRGALEDQGLNSSTAILCLAAVGLNILLPNISFDEIAKEEIENIKNNLAEERIQYLNSMTEIADETYERLNSGYINNIIQWAETEIDFKIVPKARLLEKNIKKLAQGELKKSGFSFWKDKVPVIGKAYLEGGTIQGSKVAAEEILKLILPIMIQNEERRNLPEIAYAFRITQALRK